MATEQESLVLRSWGYRTGRPGGTGERRLLDRFGALYSPLTDRAISLYAAAVLRIGYGLIYFVVLLREFPHRDEIWGPGSPWTPALATQLFDQTGWVSVLTLSDSRVYFEFCYATALVICALFMIGWRTRAMSILFAIVVTSFHARAIFMTDGGDNLIVLIAMYLCLTACGRRWSLDASRARRRVSGAELGRRSARQAVPELWRQLGAARRILTTVLHNCGMVIIAVQVCFVYACAGLYKVQGAYWQNGTALHYVLNLDLFRPWPALSLVLDSQLLLIAVASYVTVLLQVALPFVLFSRLKYVVLTMLLGLHLSIAILMGLPIFSAAMIIADAVFLPDRFYRFVGQWCRDVVQRRGRQSTIRSGSTPRQSDPRPITAPPHRIPVRFP